MQVWMWPVADIFVAGSHWAFSHGVCMSEAQPALIDTCIGRKDLLVRSDQSLLLQ
jgi:hypothetical protein